MFWRPICQQRGRGILPFSYFYTWCIISRGYSVRDAVFITAASRAVQFLCGILLGGILWWTRRYKWLIFAGVAIRFIGYRLMFRIRDSRSTTAEIIIVQVIQGMGDALVGTCSFVVSTVAVAHKEVAQMTSLAVCLSTLGSTVGTAIGGGIYTRSSWLRHPCHFLQAPVTSADRWAYPV